MDYLSRLILAFLLFVSTQAFAVVPTVGLWNVNFDPSYYPLVTNADPLQACKTAISNAYGAGSSHVSSTIFTIDPSGNTGSCSGSWGSKPAYKTFSCPVNSTSVSGLCICKTGYVQSGGSCVPEVQCVAGIKGGSSGLAAGAYCQLGCEVAATTVVTPSGSKQVWMSTGEKCADGTEPPPTAPGSASAPAGNGPCAGGASVCPPTNGACPKGTFATEVGGQALCVAYKQPDEAPPSSNTTGQNTSTGTTTTTSSTTTNANGSTTTTTTSTSSGTTTKPNEVSAFCKENPQASVCADGGSFSGSCGAFVCGGDPVQCAQAKAAAELRCHFDVPITDPSVVTGKAAMAGQGDTYNKTDGSLGSFNTTNPYSSTCVSDVVVTAAGLSFTIPISRVCPYVQFIGLCLVAGATLAGARIAFT